MSLTCNPSPSERVRLFLDEQAARNLSEASVRLPPVRQIASHLKVSTATVHHVYKEMIREGRIQTGVGRGTFLVNPLLGSVSQEGRRLRIAITTQTVFQEQEENYAWSHTLVNTILKVLTRSPGRITVQPMGDPDCTPEEVFQQLLDEREHVDGLIFGFQSRLLPFKDRLEAAYAAAGKPIVYIHVQDLFYTSTNSVLSNFFHPSQVLGEVLYQAGRRRIVYLCPRRIDRAVSHQQRLFGLQLGVTAAGGGDEHFPPYWSTADCCIEDGYQAVRKQLAQSKQAPDAIFCAGDYLALGALRAVEEAGLSCPKDVSIIGSAGINLAGTIRPEMTRMRQRFDEVAERVVRMLIQRIESKGASLPGESPSIDWHFGDTTTVEENRLLQERLQSL